MAGSRGVVSPVRGVLLDVDGTLVASNDAHASAWVDVLAETGRRVPFAEVRPLIGMGADKVLPRLSGLEEDSDEGKRIVERRRQIFLDRYLPTLRSTPGAPQLVRRMRADGLRLIVASSANEEELGPLLEIASAKELLEEATSSDDAERSKPDPDIVGAALRRIELPADAVVMIGDTPYDVEAAARAGVRVVAVRSGGWDDAALAGAVAIYDDPAQLLERYASSPFARS